MLGARLPTTTQKKKKKGKRRICARIDQELMEELCKICKDPNKSLIQIEAKMAGRLIPILQREREREGGNWDSHPCEALLYVRARDGCKAIAISHPRLATAF